MIRCLKEEPTPPSGHAEFEAWCESGRSGRPIQTHIGDHGIIFWLVDHRTVAVRFDDGDECFLLLCEVRLDPPETGH